MTKKQSLIIGAVVLAILAIMTGISFVFFANKDVKDKPQNLSVAQIDKNFYLMTDYHNEYEYVFKIEQMINEKYIKIDEVRTKENNLNISQEQFNIVAGQKYRFSVCYAYENSLGEFSQTLDWQPKLQLDAIDYDKVKVENDTLSWNAVEKADFYHINVISSDATVKNYTTQNTQIHIDDLECGKYDVFIFACADNSHLETSNSGNRLKIEISRKNVIKSVQNTNNETLKIVCSEKVKEFEILVDGQVKALLQVKEIKKEAGGYSCTFDNMEGILKSIDFSTQEVTIKSLTSGLLLESEEVEINE